MSLLRIFRNLSVLVILSVGVLSLIPRPAAAQSSCIPLGFFCKRVGPPNTGTGCCANWCGLRGFCCRFGENAPCTNSRQCCAGWCYIFNAQGQGRCIGNNLR